MQELPFKWARDGEGTWHRVSGVPETSVNTLCGLTLVEVEETGSQPPLEPAPRCRRCEIEGEGAPPNH